MYEYLNHHIYIEISMYLSLLNLLAWSYTQYVYETEMYKFNLKTN